MPRNTRPTFAVVGTLPPSVMVYLKRAGEQIRFTTTDDPRQLAAWFRHMAQQADRYVSERTPD